MGVLDNRDPQPSLAERPDRILQGKGLSRTAGPNDLKDARAGHRSSNGRELSRVLISLSEARGIIEKARVTRLAIEAVPVRGALGRLAGSTIRARIDVPACPLSAMDGYALRITRRPTAGPFSLRGAVFPASRSASRALRSGEATYITTGAPLPLGANAVVRVEAARREGAQLFLIRPARRHQDVMPPGEAVSHGDILLTRGEPVRAVHVGALLAQRVSRMPVARLRATVLPIGDELVASERRAARGTWDYMGPTVAALLPFAEVKLGSPLPDDRRSVENALLEAAPRSDLLITIGGSSVGERDVTKPAVREVGRLWFEGVRVNVLKRGAVGSVGRVPLVVLPGQLVSAVTVLHEHGLHVVSRMCGRELRRYERVPLSRDLRVKHHLDSTYLFSLSNGKAIPLPWGVARMTALLQADAFAVLPHGKTLRKGDLLTVQRLWQVA